MKQVLLYLLSLLSLAFVTTAAPESSARVATCNKKGYDSGTEGYYYGSEGTYTGCSAACQQDLANCKSFAYGNGECNLYTVRVAGNIVKDDSSPYTFYDASCIANSSVKSSSTTTTTTTATTATATTSRKAADTTTTTRTTSIASSTTTTNAVTTKATSTLSATQINSVTTTTKVTTSPLNSSTPVPPCPLPTWTVSNFVFFNSSHNLDCAGTDFNNPLCYTGRPPQPDGYGPPDSVSAIVSGIGSCIQQNPGTTPRREVGSDVVRCGGSAYQFAFFGDSNNELSTAQFNVQNQINCPDGSAYSAFGSVNFQMSCSYDCGMNATCKTVDETVSVQATSFTLY